MHTMNIKRNVTQSQGRVGCYTGSVKHSQSKDKGLVIKMHF